MEHSGIAPGTLVAGKYRIDTVLGQGGMGMVLAAQHVALGTPVALKVLLPGVQHHPEVMDRFLREAQAAAQLRGDHIARVIDVATLPNGSPYMVMEYLSGTDLSNLLEKKGPLAIADAVDYVLQAIEAIAEAHSVGIVHRDLKPANLFLIRRPGDVAWVKVLDFGISKLVSQSEERKDLTSTTTSLGSPLYMSPEQLRSAKSVDTRTDIWAIGVMLFELLTGTCPFDAETVHGLSLVIAFEAPRSLRELRADVPPELEAVVMRCLEKDREARYPDVAALARALVPFCTARPGRAAAENAIRILDANAEEPVPSHAQAPGTAATTQHSTNVTFSSTRGARRTPVAAIGVVAGVLVLAGLFTAGFWVLRSRTPTEAAGTADIPAPSAPPALAAPVAAATDLAPAASSAALPAASSAPSGVTSTVAPPAATHAHTTVAPPIGKPPVATNIPPAQPPPKGGNTDTAIDSRH